MKTPLSLRLTALLGVLVLVFATVGWFLRDQPAARNGTAPAPQAGSLQQQPNAVAGPTGSQASAPAVPSIEAQRTFATFAQWLTTFAQAAPAARPALLAEGQRLAEERRAVMAELMQRDPREALRLAVTLDVWRSLPPELQALVEEPFSALAHFRVLPVCAGGSPDAARLAAGEKFREVVRLTEIAGLPALDSYVFGRREALSTKENSPVQGLRLGGLAALREEVLHALEPREVAVAETLYPTANPRANRDFATGQPLGADTVVALAGGKVFKFANHASFDTFNRQIAALDQRPDPHSGAAFLFSPRRLPARQARDSISTRPRRRASSSRALGPRRKRRSSSSAAISPTNPTRPIP